MEIKLIKDKALRFAQKYQYVILIVVIGLALLVLPSRKQKQNNSTLSAQKQEQQGDKLENMLSVLLSKISGAGRVEVLLTLHTGEEYTFQTNESSNSSQDTVSKQTDTVTITDSGHNQTGLIRKTLAPTYRGAVIICEGAENPTVRLAIVEAVANATGLSTNRISVLKMK